MTVLITMAGMGSRFSNEGYSVPKHKVIAKGRTLFEWSILSLSNFFAQEFVFATLEGEDEEWLVKHALEIGIKSCKIISRRELSTGQAETAYDVVSSLNPSEPLWIYNIDTYVAQGMLPSDMDAFAGCIPVFTSVDPGMSFVRYDGQGQVDAIAEKRVISKWATVGMYGFESIGSFCEVSEAAYKNEFITAIKGERYIAPMYDFMLRRGDRLSAPKLNSEYVHILGTPAQLLRFDKRALPPLGSID